VSVVANHAAPYGQQHQQGRTSGQKMQPVKKLKSWMSLALDNGLNYTDFFPFEFVEGSNALIVS
jgi:hypothetical protein